MKSNIKDFFTYSSSQIIVLLISIIISAIWARNTTQEEYGAYQLVISLIAIAGIFNFPGLTMAMQLSSAHHKNGNLTIAIKRKVKYSFFSALFLIFVGVYYSIFKNNELVTYMLYIAAIAYPLYSLNSLWESWFTGIRKVKRLSLFFILNSLISLLIISLGLLVIQNVIVTVFLLLFSIAIFNFIILKFFTLEDKTNEIDEDTMKYGYALSGAVIISMLVNLDRFIISEYLTLSDVAIYSVAVLFASKVKILHATVNKLIAPSILKANSICDAWNYLKFRLVLIWFGFIVVAIFGFFFIDDIIILIFSEKYAESAIYAQWLWLIMFSTRPVQYIGNILKSQKIVRFSYYFETINGFGRLALFLILLPFYKLWGIVYATFIINILTLIYTITAFNYYYKKELSNE
jgi:O-antigen/teichoic acid export membrane protein